MHVPLSGSRLGFNLVAIAGLAASEGWLPGSDESAIGRSMGPKKLDMKEPSASASALHAHAGCQSSHAWKRHVRTHTSSQTGRSHSLAC